MNKFIVCTTINKPTEALLKFSQMEDWMLIVVCDKKTPVEAYRRPEFDSSYILTPKILEGLYPELSRMLGWNNVDIRNLGFLFAYNHGASIVAMVDDDNVPLPTWGKEIHLGKQCESGFVKYYLCRDDIGVFDPLSVFRRTNGFHWHRGYPIHLVGQRYDHDVQFELNPIQYDIQANLWNIEMDYDATCKMIDWYRPEPPKFNRMDWYTSYHLSPFNMQNTLVSRRALKHCPSIPFTGRMCDIWGAYYCQAMGHKVLYGPPTVDHIQADRSWLSLCKDAEEELLGYKCTKLAEDMLEVEPKRALQAVLPSISYEFVCAYEESFK